MRTRRQISAGLVAAALLPWRMARAGSNDASAQAFLDQIYAHYTGRAGTEGVDLSSEAEIRRLFDPPLATLILADRRQSETNDEPSALDGDPFVDAQDWMITDLHITILHAAGGKASAEVRFNNLDHEVTIRIDLVKLANGWRISGIDYGTTTLTRILTSG